MFITLNDGKKLEFKQEVTVAAIAERISESLKRNAVCGKVNGKLVDLSHVINEDASVDIFTLKDKEGMNVFRHTCAHVLAQAVKSIFPTCRLAIGPVIENGFYYDFDFTTPVTQADLAKIEQEMKKIIKSDLPIERFEISRKEAIKIFKGFKETYKLELAEDIPDGEPISIYKQGAFVDLCKGPHLPSTGKIKAFKLTSITGAYWRGNENNKMLTRIYGTAFPKKAELEDYLVALEEAKKRDHNKLGRELGLFMTEETIGQGLPILMPKGAKIMQILNRFVEDEEEKRGFMITKTPTMAKSDLYKISGHWYHYRDKMFILGDEESDDELLALRPMTCPFQYQIYKNGLKSYRDLPCRYAETATLFRNEASGEMHGLIRVRQFTLADGHVICTPEQIEEEFKRCLELCLFCLKALGMENDVTYRFSKRGANKEKYIDNDEAWEQTQALMRLILNHLNVEYIEADDEAAFYGPKLDIQAKNVFGKEDTIMTLQLDFAAGKAFDMSYIDANGEKKTPFVIHRSSIGCYERTLAMLIEKYAGAFPLWISPLQVKILSVTDRSIDYAKSLADKLTYAGIRVECDFRSEKIGRKIRDAQLEKIPYMLVLGDREVENGSTVSVRERNGKNYEMSTDEFIAKIVFEDKNKVIK
ncbi:MAG: threonine--tRNA ligase [Candidatus Borkfalkiaceae bacterium]|nr:threonine--tRNA ligase [Christensenellaceae bacterium]